MRVISRKALREFWEAYPDAEQPLEGWYRITNHAEWSNLAQTRHDFPHADPVGDCTVMLFWVSVQDSGISTQVIDST
jgi:mRNA interferase HigB